MEQRYSVEDYFDLVQREWTISISNFLGSIVDPETNRGVKR